MKTEIIESKKIAIITSDALLFTDTQTALDFAMGTQYETDCRKMIVYKENLPETFFDLSTRLAGDILQKFVTYQIQIAIVGDFSSYKSESLHSFIYESNRGNHFFFPETLDDAIKKLS